MRGKDDAAARALLAQGPLAETLTRIDLPIKLGEDVGSILEAVIEETDDEWNLAKVAFPGGSLWTRDQGIPIGRMSGSWCLHAM